MITALREWYGRAMKMTARFAALLVLTVSACNGKNTPPSSGDADGADALLADGPAGDGNPTGDDFVPSDGEPGDLGPGDTEPGDVAPGDSGGDAGGNLDVPLGPNVIANGSFELWTDGLPDSWFGSTSSITATDVDEDTSASHDGLRACQLTDSAEAHRRFTTLAMSLAAGDYSCSYWVRGTGEIRNAYFDGDYSSYSSYVSVDNDAWQRVSYSFHLAQAVPDLFELIFSVRLTDESRGHLHIDDVHCGRGFEPCDAVVCEEWQSCNPATEACEPLVGRCDSGDDCALWQECDGAHTCGLLAGRCNTLTDCSEPTRVCDEGHTCAAGDPCAGVPCDEWRECDPADASCALKSGRCMTTADCTGALPVCDIGTHTCVAVEETANVVPNGGFEHWRDVELFGSTVLLPDSWFGLCDSCSPYFPETEMDATDVLPYSTSTHSGATACQLIEPSTPAKRFTTERFAVTPGVPYACAYWVRGQGTHRHRTYCGAWGTNTDFVAIDSTDWQQVTFDLTGSASSCVLIFYASNTVADKDHIQIDDVVCSRKFP